MSYLSAIETIPIYDPVFSGLTIPLSPDERLETVKYKVCSKRSINLDHGPYEGRTVSDFTWNNICEAIKKGYSNPKDIIFEFFRQALIQNDSIGQFMLLYNVMLQISNDNQKEVDKQIEEISPGIRKIPFKYIQNGVSKSGDETVYSKLRNEIAHRREHVNINTTLSEIEKVLPEFREIVQKCIIIL